jgi:hypothetical protein
MSPQQQDTVHHDVPAFAGYCDGARTQAVMTITTFPSHSRGAPTRLSIAPTGGVLPDLDADKNVGIPRRVRQD